MEEFQQYEFEHAIYACLPFGFQEQLAKALGKSPGLISQYLSPSDDRQSPIFRAAQMLAVLIDVDPEAGRKALDVFNYFVRRSLPDNESLCIHSTRQEAYRQDCEAKLAEASGADLDICIKEKEEEIAAEMEHLEAMRAARKRELRGDIFRKVEAQFKNGRRANG